MARIIGRAKIIVNGRTLESEKGAKLKLGGTKRTAHVSDNGTVHYSEETVPAELDCKILATPDCPIEEMRNFVDAVIQYAGDNGITYQVRNGFTLDALELASGEPITLKMAGNPAERI